MDALEILLISRGCDWRVRREGGGITTCASIESTTARSVFLEGCAACSDAAHWSMFSLLLVASSHESKAHLRRSGGGV